MAKHLPKSSAKGGKAKPASTGAKGETIQAAKHGQKSNGPTASHENIPIPPQAPATAEPPTAATSAHAHDAAGSSRERLMAAGKHLFSHRGYESASTSEIAREAQTSESQLIKHFGSKEGLLEAIFDAGWQTIGYAFRAIHELPTPGERLEALLELMLKELERDSELKTLFLLHGRRTSKVGDGVVLTQGYLRFVGVVDAILNEARAKGEMRPELRVDAVRSTLIAMFEGLLRDQLLASRVDFPAAYSSTDIRRIFKVVLNAFIPE